MSHVAAPVANAPAADTVGNAESEVVGEGSGDEEDGEEEEEEEDFE